MKRLIPVCLFDPGFFGRPGQHTWSVKFSNAILFALHAHHQCDDVQGMGVFQHNYSPLVLKVYNQVNTASYLNYIKGFIDTYLNADGSFRGATVTLTSLDRIHPGISVLFLYEN